MAIIDAEELKHRREQFRHQIDMVRRAMHRNDWRSVRWWTRQAVETLESMNQEEDK